MQRALHRRHGLIPHFIHTKKGGLRSQCRKAKDNLQPRKEYTPDGVDLTKWAIAQALEINMQWLASLRIQVRPFKQA